ncbi:MAG: antitoxin [Microthrixaceae bacterium]
MRTTVTLDPDVAAGVRRVMAEQGRSFKEALNEVARRGLRAEATHAEPYTSPTFRSRTHPGLDLHKALALAGDLEDDEVLRRAEQGK